MFGEEVSNRFLAKWPTYFKPRILADYKNSNEYVEDLLSGHQSSDESGWDSDLSSILLLVHILPRTAKGPKKSPKIGSHQAVKHVVRYLRIGASVETFLESLEPGQPIVLCVGAVEQENNLQRFYIIVDYKAIPCKAQSALAAFDELFKAHFIFSVNYQESLNSFYTFIQTTVFNIDVGSTEESPCGKELRARLLNTSI